MNEDEASVLAEQVRGAVHPAGNMSAAELARRAGVSENTLAKVRHGLPVSRRSAERVRAALGAPPPVDTLDANAPPDVRIVQQVVGMWMLGLDPERRGQAAYRLIRLISESEPVNGGPAG